MTTNAKSSPLTPRQIEAAANYHAGPFPVANIGVDGEYYIALGHVDPETFLEVVDGENSALGIDPWDADHTDVQHVWVIAEDPDQDSDWAISWSSQEGGPVKETDPGAFPVTVLAIDI
jgi:hypothetical protein